MTNSNLGYIKIFATAAAFTAKSTLQYAMIDELFGEIPGGILSDFVVSPLERTPAT